MLQNTGETWHHMVAGGRALHLIKVSVKDNEVPTEKNSSRASIFATKAS